jgi:hypothetical protein
MYPQRLSTRAEITKSERALHKRLSDALDDDWTVIHASGLLISDGTLAASIPLTSSA